MSRKSGLCHVLNSSSQATAEYLEILPFVTNVSNVLFGPVVFQEVEFNTVKLLNGVSNASLMDPFLIVEDDRSGTVSLADEEFRRLRSALSPEPWLWVIRWGNKRIFLRMTQEDESNIVLASSPPHMNCISRFRPISWR